VLDNLLANAIKYSPAGGRIVVTLGQDQRQGEDWAVLTVQDEGVGIPAVDLAHIFERFRRGSNVTGRFAGTGIGLSGARRIVEQHGGTIAVESEQGRGSMFTVSLPLTPPEPAEES
jgi:signal transduction histidine kinase